MLRVVVLVNAVLLNVYRFDNFQRPTAGVACVVVMVVWTGAAIWLYSAARRRGPLLLGADLLIAVALLALSPVVKGAGFNASVPGFWVMGALMAWAIHYRLLGGMIASASIAFVDVVVREEFTQTNYGNVFLVLIGGPIVGFMCGSLQQMAVERDRAERAAAAASERARLARAVHDGVLQVLSLVQRRGRELGGQGADLARLAGEQESALRLLIREQDAVGTTTRGESDLVAALTRLESREGVNVAAPGGLVELASDVVDELVAVVSACLHNVTHHVGEGAPAWVLLEAWPDRVEVSVRDEGPGIPEGRLDEAADQGRLGVSQSIRGRIADLGGTATVTTGSFGTEWEFVVPRRQAP